MTLALEELESCVSGGTDPESYVNRKELERAITCFLKQRSQRERTLFLGRYFYLHSVRELAERYGLKENHVLQILSRTRKRLRTFLEQEGYVL